MRMQGMTIFAAFIALSLTGMALPVQANMVVISRDTTISATSDCFDTSDPTCFVNDLGVLVGQRSDHYTDTGNYDKNVKFNAASAVETSTISNTRILVSQAAFGGAANLFSVGEASFAMSFSLDAPEKYDLDWSLSSHYTGHDQEVKFTGPDGVIVDDTLGSNEYVSGVLNPGLYTLLVHSRAHAIGLSSSEAYSLAELTLTPVPLPDSLVLSASGLLLVGLLMRIRRPVLAAHAI